MTGLKSVGTDRLGTEGISETLRPKVLVVMGREIPRSKIPLSGIGTWKNLGAFIWSSLDLLEVNPSYSLKLVRIF